MVGYAEVDVALCGEHEGVGGSWSGRPRAGAPSLPSSSMMVETMGVGASSMAERVGAMALPMPGSSASRLRYAPWGVDEGYGGEPEACGQSDESLCFAEAVGVDGVAFAFEDGIALLSDYGGKVAGESVEGGDDGAVVAIEAVAAEFDEWVQDWR